MILREWARPIDWLYTRIALPGLIDGWLLADQYHDIHADRPVILCGTEARVSKRGDIVLNQPTPSAACDTIHHALAMQEAVSADDERQAA